MSVDRKQLILEAAANSFAQYGYKATTMEQVARLANVGKGTIYTFFKNKEELFDEIVSSLLKEMRDEADKAIDQNSSFFENVHRALYRILEYRRKHQLTIKIFQESAELGTPAVQEVVQRLEKMIIDHIKSRISVAIQKGELQDCDPELTAFVMLKLYISLIFDWEKQHAPLEKEQIAKYFELYLLKGLSK
ncbi:TetR family transcriptional regulator [Bacillus lacus]|uniref:TetR family transcriptional regulator n=1 Tax=Metabacillus lacus TaxID=1983721 RepID=A0A7X2IX79_9BACI|nr:TetR/AcrR family transcriptional regulator [Metabacillus lacus]MRX71445.1 TetR family transcriptional regulator [Metabacillus lacus]